MITVHQLDNSCSQRLLWLLKELGDLYEAERYQHDSKIMLAFRELTRMHSFGKSPFITDNRKTIAETGAIIEYIRNNHGDGRLIPKSGTSERLRFTYWLHYAEGSVMMQPLLKVIFTHIPNSVRGLMRGLLRSVVSKLQERVSDHQVLWHLNGRDEELSKFKWFTGNELTAAEIITSLPLEAAKSRASGRSRPMLAAFLKRIHVRPAYINAMKKGGPHDCAS